MSASILVIACGAIARELIQLKRSNGWDHMDVQCLPAELHNRPEKIPQQVEAKLKTERGRYDSVFVAYADCGTGGALDRLLEPLGISRLPGAHCYEFFAGSEAFGEMAEQEPGTFYLTDFLTRHFDRLVIEGLGLDKHPQLLDSYFGNYRRLVYLAQSRNEELERKAREAADRLQLTYEFRYTGLAPFEQALGGKQEQEKPWRS
ncbi:MAG: DUF1638 domain-containing protein [Gammaproteobacteria bacterium]|nr:DUF1638 domain-containing protein [Gammaproteobacteria bacterium]